MARQRSENAEVALALHDELLRALCTALRHVYPDHGDFRVDVKPVGNRFKVTFNEIYYPPLHADGTPDDEANTKLADEEYAIAHNACTELTTHLQGRLLADSVNPFGMDIDYEHDSYCATKEQWVKALNDFFATREPQQPAIANPTLTLQKQR